MSITMTVIEEGDPIPDGLRASGGLLLDRNRRVVGSIRQTCEVYPKRKLGEPLTDENRGLICRCGAEGIVLELDTPVVRQTYHICAAECCKSKREGFYRDGWKKWEKRS